MQPIVDGLRDEFDEQVSFVYLNANEEGKSAFDQLGLFGHPGFLLFTANGEEVYRGISIVAEEVLREVIQAQIAESE